jgi:putative hydrolase of the HAD superfamily
MFDVLHSFGLSASLSGLLQATDGSSSWLMAAWQTKKEITTQEQAHRIATEAVGAKLPDDPELSRRLNHAYVDPVLELPPRLNEGAKETLQGMRSRVQRLGLICNIGRSSGEVLRQLLRNLGVLDFFDVTVFSDEIGWRKPDKRIFQAAANQMHVAISTIVHIGDHPEADAWGAKQAGMLALLLDVPTNHYKGRDLALLWRSTSTLRESEINPDGRISSLEQALTFVDALKLSESA